MVSFSLSRSYRSMSLGFFDVRTGLGVHSVQGERIQQVEFQFGDPTGVQNQVHGADLLLHLVRRNFAAIYVDSPDSAQPFWSGGVRVDHVQTVNLAAAQPQD